MKYSLILILLCTFSACYSQEIKYDFVIKIDNSNSITLVDQVISKRTLKDLMRRYRGENPHILLKLVDGVEQPKIEKIKKLISTEFSSFIVDFDFQDQEILGKYEYFVTGTIRDQNDQPLKHINIIATGTRTGLVSDEYGHFAIRIPKEARSLVVDHKDFKKFVVEMTEIAKLKETESLEITLSHKKF